MPSSRRSKLPKDPETELDGELKATVVSHDSVPRIVDVSNRKTATPSKKAPPTKTARGSNGTASPKVVLNSDDEEMLSADDDSTDESDEGQTEHNDAYVFHERFFESAKRSKTSNNTLTLNKSELQRKIEELAAKPPSQIVPTFSKNFDYWLLLLAEGYNLLLHGLGSKLQTMKDFREKLEVEGYDTVFVNAFYEGSTDKQLFDAILTDFAQIKPPGPVEQALESVIQVCQLCHQGSKFAQAWLESNRKFGTLYILYNK